jgi:hypothetical protein
VLETPDRIIYRVLDCPISMEPEKDRECVSTGFNLQESKFSVGSMPRLIRRFGLGPMSGRAMGLRS